MTTKPTEGLLDAKGLMAARSAIKAKLYPNGIDESGECKEMAEAAIRAYRAALTASPPMEAVAVKGQRHVAERAVPDSVISAFEQRYSSIFDMAPFDGEWGNTDRYKHHGIQMLWEGWRECYLANITSPLAPPPLSNPEAPAVPVGGEHGDKIYIASKTKHAQRWQTIASVYPVSSTWIYEAGAGETADFHDLWQRCLTEAAGSKALVIYREPDEVLKGAWIELGAAQAHGVPIHAVGIEEFTIAGYRGITHHRTMKEAVAAALKEPSRASLVATPPAPTSAIMEKAFKQAEMLGSAYLSVDPDGGIELLDPTIIRFGPVSEQPAPAVDGRAVIEELKFALFSNDLGVKDRADQAARLYLAALAGNPLPSGGEKEA